MVPKRKFISLNPLQIRYSNPNRCGWSPWRYLNNTELSTDDLAEEEGWTKAKWKNVVRVLADFLKYLFECAQAYIQETHASGISLWESLAENIVYVFTHPNGWEGPQQSQMREAAILAGLITDDAVGKSRITFVTEGEASLHFCLNNGLAPDALEKGDGIVIVDAGGGTIDISAYRGQSEAFHETAIPQCHFQGSIFVTVRAKAHLERHLEDTHFEDDVPHIVQLFDKGAKLTFRDDATPHFVRFGRVHDSDSSLDIRNGQIKLSGFGFSQLISCAMHADHEPPSATIATFFQPSISCIVKAVREQHIFLVGGFAASDWLFKGVKDALRQDGLEVARPDSHVNKAVSDGAAAFFLDHYVESRISRTCFGALINLVYDDENPEHVRRSGLVQQNPASGIPCFLHSFSTILPKNEPVRETKEYRRVYRQYYEKRKASGNLSAKIYSYKGERKEPTWIHEERDLYDYVGTVRADLNGMEAEHVKTLLGWRYRIKFDVVLLFGLTELKAQVAWINDSGIEKRGPAEVVFEPNL
ncbi:hypothetical protein BKA70DRAFT_1466558 [Coprinopsis sp. MPI-PUGE-AT-0042]|nr:hypothetical protein BKA70DRAFT_1466558 [Coprinopsis sp. MPI-PUGE-AT-0042]